MKIEERKAGRAVVLSPVGRLNGAGGRLLEGRVAELAGRGETSIVLDCGRTVIGSAGLRALLLCTRLCRRDGGELSVVSLKPECRTLLEVSGMLIVLDHRETGSAALAARNRARRRGGGRADRDRAAMTVQESEFEAAVVLFPIGRLNDEGAGVLEARVYGFVDRGKALIVLDCARIDYVSSAGLRALLLCAKICAQEGGKLVIAALQPQCRSVIEMSGFLSVIEHRDTREEALSALA